MKRKITASITRLQRKKFYDLMHALEDAVYDLQNDAQLAESLDMIEEDIDTLEEAAEIIAFSLRFAD